MSDDLSKSLTLQSVNKSAQVEKKDYKIAKRR